MRIVVSSARTALEQDLSEMHEKESISEQVITALAKGLDSSMLISAAYVETAESIQHNLLPTAYFVHSMLRERIANGQCYANALSLLDEMDIWDSDELESQFEQARQSYQTLCDLRDAAPPESMEIFTAACTAAESLVYLWERKKNNFQIFISTTSGLYEDCNIAANPAYCQYPSGSVNLDMNRIDGEHIRFSLFDSPNSLGKSIVVDEFEQIHPDIATKMQEIYDKSEYGVISEETWLAVRYYLYTAPERLRNIYLTNSDSISTIYIHQASDGSSGSGTAYNSYERSLTIEEISGDAERSADRILHEWAHSIDHIGANPNYRNAAFPELELTDVPDGRTPEGVEDILNLYYKTALETLENRHKGRLTIPFLDKWTDKITANTYKRIVGNAALSAEGKSLCETMAENDPRFADTIHTYVERYGDNPLLSDLSSGATGNILKGICGHSDEYWRDDPSAINNEGFASYLSSSVRGELNYISEMQNHAPRSVALYENVIDRAAKTMEWASHLSNN